MSNRYKLILITFILVSVSKGNAFELSLKRTATFTLGALSSVAAHEGGHWLMLEHYNRDYEFYFDGISPKYRYVGGPKNSIQMAGLTTTMLASEGVLLLTDEDRGPFWQGFLVGSALNEILYPVLRYNQGDFKYMHGKDKVIFAGLSIVHGCLTLFRLYKDDQLTITSWVGVHKGRTPVSGFKISW